MQNGADPQPDDDDGGMYGVFGEGKPRRIVGESDEPPRRRPRKQPPPPAAGSAERDRR